MTEQIKKAITEAKDIEERARYISALLQMISDGNMGSNGYTNKEYLQTKLKQLYKVLDALAYTVSWIVGGRVIEENTFDERERKIAECDKFYGMDDLQGIDRTEVWYEAYKRISGSNVTDEEEKRKVYAEVKQLYFEYKQQKGSETT